MKKILLLIFFCVISLTSFAQLQGSFKYAQDGHIYFYLQNPTYYPIQVIWGAFNFDKNQNRQSQGVMAPGGTFIFGPNCGWIWEEGECFGVTYTNGEIESWRCPATDPAARGNTSFKGGSDWIAVTVRVSGCDGWAGSLCSCKTYKGYRRRGFQDKYKGNCGNCGHGPKAHGLDEW